MERNRPYVLQNLVTAYQTTRCHNPENHALNLHRHETFRSQLYFHFLYIFPLLFIGFPGGDCMLRSLYVDMLGTFTRHCELVGQYGTGLRVIKLTNCILTATDNSHLSSCSGRMSQTGYSTFQEVPYKRDEAERNRDGQGAAVGLRKIMYKILLWQT
jgi:hypothetical protein